MTIQDIYGILDTYAPFSLQESYDKSGLLVGDPQKPVHRILLTLDITIPVVQEAADKHCDLIVSHHPVIWDPLRAVSPSHPVWHLVKQEIGAICSHTCLDIAPGGLNDFVGGMLLERIPMQNQVPLAVLSPGRTLGCKADLLAETSIANLAEVLRRVFVCRSLRYYAAEPEKPIRSIAWCTGSGGDLIPDAIAAGADALITGDCKHSIWVEAQNRGFTLFDCGHFETEVPVVRLLQRILLNSGAELLISDAGTKPLFSV